MSLAFVEMSKVGGALPAWYWPPGLPRRAAVPQQPIQLQLGRQVRRAPDRPALASTARTLTYRQLWKEMLAAGRAIEGLEPATVGVCEADGLEAVLLLLGALEAGKRVALLDCEAPAERLASQLAGAEAPLVLFATAPGAAKAVPGVRLLARAELTPGEAVEGPGRVEAKEPAVLLGAGPDMAVHSHLSLSAMGAGLATFLPELRELAFCWVGPACSWEALTGIVVALQNGMPVAFASAAELRCGDHAFPDDAYTILPRADADAFLAAGAAPAILSRLRHVFVSTGPFTRRWRRRLEDLLGRAVLTLWGAQELGPVVSAHPSWVPVQAHGIPLVNVTLMPIDPASGRVSLVPWELLDRAGLGVESPSAMSGYTNRARTEATRLGRIVCVPSLAEIDHVGVVSIHP